MGGDTRVKGLLPRTLEEAMFLLVGVDGAGRERGELVSRGC